MHRLRHGLSRAATSHDLPTPVGVPTDTILPRSGPTYVTIDLDNRACATEKNEAAGGQCQGPQGPQGGLKANAKALKAALKANEFLEFHTRRICL